MSADLQNPEEVKKLAEQQKNAMQAAWDRLPASERKRLIEKRQKMQLEREAPHLNRHQRRLVLAEAKRRKKKGLE